MTAVLIAAATAAATPTPGPSVVADAASIGITPESLVIGQCGLSAAQGALARVEVEAELRQALHQRQELADQACIAVSALRKLLADDPANEQLLSQYAEAVGQLEDAQQQLKDTRDELFEAAMDDVSGQVVQRVTKWRDGAQYAVAPEFRVDIRPVEQWKAIERALRAESRAMRLGEPVPQVEAQLLAQVRSDPMVVQTAFSLQVNLQAMEALFAQFGG